MLVEVVFVDSLSFISRLHGCVLTDHGTIRSFLTKSGYDGDWIRRSRISQVSELLSNIKTSFILGLFQLLKLLLGLLLLLES